MKDIAVNSKSRLFSILFSVLLKFRLVEYPTKIGIGSTLLIFLKSNRNIL